jgi:glucan phosphoethanolaminetransferase (alkaline phosphatase superfamily)
MRLFLENPVNEAMPWRAMCLFALLLFLTAVAITALLIRQKRCRLLWLVIPILCLSYFMEQCFGTASRGYTYSQVAADMQMAIIGLPGWLLLIFCLALALAEILLMQSINLLEKNSITPMSVKEAVDSLPAGILCYAPGAKVQIGRAHV